MVNIPGELAAITLRAIIQRMRAMRKRGPLPKWLHFQMATEDWWKGYRQLIPALEDMAISIAAVVNPDTGEWEFTQMYGVPFGLGVANNQFGRMASLQEAIARRILYILTGKFVDDNFLLELSALTGRAQIHFGSMARLLGVRLSDDKRQSMGSYKLFLGHIHDLSRMMTDNAIVFGPKPGLREKIVDKIDEILRLGELSPGQASKLRGVLTWLDTCITGKCCRGALGALIARQYWEQTSAITENLRISLCFLKAAAREQPDRCIPLSPGDWRPTVVYTDASADDQRVRIGAIIYSPGMLPAVMVYDPPDEIRKLWGEGKTIIAQAELHAVPLLAYSAAHRLQRRDIIWFLDNEAAEGAMVKAGSPQVAMCGLALVGTAVLGRMQARTWYEHVSSADNPSDVLSRAGFDDATVAEKVRNGAWEVIAPSEPPWERGLDFDYWWSAD